MSRRKLIALSVVGAGVLAAALIGASVLTTRSSSRATAPATVAGAGEVRALLAGIPQHGTALGQATAPVTLVEYGDLQCPFCGRFAVRDFPQLVRQYVRTGRLRILFRGLAFIGPDSETALNAALAAGKQDRLWNVVELLYANQGAENSGWVTAAELRLIGSAVPGLDVERMLAESGDPSVARTRVAAADAAQRDGVNATPSFVVGRTGGPTKLLGSNDPRTLRAAIGALLAR